MTSPFHTTMKRVAQIHFWLLFFSFVTYTLAGFALGPGFFKADFLDRLQALADDVIVVTATVLGPPAEPIVTATPVCVSGAPRIVLDWADDEATDTWDIERDTLPLVTGLTSSTYTDTAVTANTTYEYVVTANGPMAPGTAISDPVSATALDCPTLLPDPTVLIQTLGDRNVSVDRSGIRLSKRRPTVTGTTNIPNALITVLLTNPTIEAQTVANTNGYFVWIPPIRLDTGTHFLSVTATDPNDNARTVTDTLTFRIRDDEEDDDEDEAETAILPPGGQMIDFSLQVDNVDSIAFQGSVLGLSVRSVRGAFPPGTTLSPFIIDARGEEVVRLPSVRTDEATGTEISLERTVPLSLLPGEYRVRVDAQFGRLLVSREARLVVRALPLLDLGGGQEITYAEAARFIGTIFYSLLLLFLLYLLFFFREYLLSLRALRQVTEYHLARLGFIPKRRKEVKR